MKVAVIANGDWDALWGKQELKDFELLICADGGANYAFSSGYLPQVLIGDLDSITPENLAACEANKVLIKRFPKEKDETDLELALEFAVKYISDHNDKLKAGYVGTSQTTPSSEQAEEIRDIWLYAAAGGRMDHFLGNLALLQKYGKQGIRIHLKDPRQEMWILQGQEKIKGRKGQELSLIILSDQAAISTKDLYYPLHHETLRQDTPRGISNVFLGEDAVVEVHSGVVLVVVIS